VNYDDEMLMAYVDGELDAARAAEIAAAAQADAALAARIATQRQLRERVTSAFANVPAQEVPERLLAAARGPTAEPAAAAPARGNVVQFPSRGTRAPPTAWRAREWTAMAASLLLGVFLTWRMLAPAGGASFETRGGELVAAHDLAAALDGQLAAHQAADAPVRVGVSFKSRAGGYCRSFELRTAGSAGVACREADAWRVEVLAKSAGASGEMRQAATLPPAVIAAIAATIDGDPLDAAGEEAARKSAWTVPR
jgi:hypothetical protein